MALQATIRFATLCRTADDAVITVDADGTIGLAAAWHKQVLRPGLTIEFTPPAGS